MKYNPTMDSLIVALVALQEGDDQRATSHLFSAAENESFMEDLAAMQEMNMEALTAEFGEGAVTAALASMDDEDDEDLDDEDEDDASEDEDDEEADLDDEDEEDADLDDEDDEEADLDEDDEEADLDDDDDEEAETQDELTPNQRTTLSTAEKVVANLSKLR